MLKLDKIKKLKIWLFIIGFIVVVLKAIKYGVNREKSKQQKNSPNVRKYAKETDEIVDNANSDEFDKLL